MILKRALSAIIPTYSGNKITASNDDESHMDLHTACALGNIKAVKELLGRRNKNDTSKRNNSGWTALMYACYHDYDDIITELIQAGAKANVLNFKDQSALMIAAARDSTSALEMVFVKEQLNITDYDGCSALNYAMAYGCDKSVRWLLQKGANANSIENGEPLLMVAIRTGRESFVRMLLEFGAHPNTFNSNGESAEMVAEKSGHHNIAMLLQSHIQGGQTLLKLFRSLSLEKYWPIMYKNNIDLGKFLKLTEDELKRLGIILLGPRRKMALAISDLNEQKFKCGIK